MEAVNAESKGDVKKIIEEVGAVKIDDVEDDVEEKKETADDVEEIKEIVDNVEEEKETPGVDVEVVVEPDGEVVVEPDVEVVVEPDVEVVVEPEPIRLAREKGAPLNPLTWGLPGELTDEEVSVYVSYFFFFKVQCLLSEYVFIL